MYPNIPTQQGIGYVVQECRNFYEKDEELLPPAERAAIRCKMRLTRKLMTLVLTHNFVKYDNTIYLQREGTAMGTALAPAYANLFMATLERRHFESDTRIRFYRRFIDDIFIIVQGTRNDAENLMESLGELHPKIKFDYSIDKHHAIFLDLNINLLNRNGQVSIETSTYQKPMNIYQYIPWSSAHPVAVKRAFVKAELLRFCRNSTSRDAYAKTVRLFYGRLRARGYPPRWLNSTFAEVVWNRDHDHAVKPKEKSIKRQPFVFKATMNPVWDLVDMQPVWSTLRGHWDRSHLLSSEDWIVMSRKRIRTLGDLVNTSNKKKITG
jgi:hypothetical protein